jgi:hypothetical protein
MMPSANKLHRLSLHLKAIKVSRLNRNHSHKLVPSLQLQISSPRTTLLTLNNEMPTTIITTSMACSKAHKARRDLLLNSDHSAGTMDHNQKPPPNSHKALLNKLSHVTRLLERVKPVATLLLIQLLKVSNLVLVKVLNHSQVTNNSHNTLTAILTTPARTMLRT